MSTIERYRANAHDCLWRAHTEENQDDRPLWLTLAQSWLRLAEHADRTDRAIRGEEDESAAEN